METCIYETHNLMKKKPNECPSLCLHRPGQSLGKKIKLPAKMTIQVPITGNPSHHAPIQFGSPSLIVTSIPGITYNFKQTFAKK